MLIETLTGKTFTPVDACAWSVEHGYKALNQNARLLRQVGKIRSPLAKMTKYFTKLIIYQATLTKKYQIRPANSQHPAASCATKISGMPTTKYQWRVL